jgi:hypothetical protein
MASAKDQLLLQQKKLIKKLKNSLESQISNIAVAGIDSIDASSVMGLGSLATVSPTGTANSSTYLRGDFTWATVSSSGGGFDIDGGSATVYTGIPDIDGGSA